MSDQHITAQGIPILFKDVNGDGTDYSQAVTVLSTPASTYPDSSTLTSVEVDDEPQVILAEANPNRLGVTIHNHSDDQLYISLGDTVTTSLFTQVLGAHAYYELPTPCYRGVITAMRPSGNALAPVMLTELFRAV